MSKAPRLGRPSALGASNYTAALSNIKKLRMQSARVLTSYGLSLAETLDRLFPVDTIAAAHAGRRVTCESIANAGGYKLGNATLLVGYREHTSVLPIHEELLRKDVIDSAAELFAYIEELDMINRQYAVLKHVVTWLDTYGSAGAMRYYFPSVAALCSVELASEPTTFRDPSGVGRIVPLIREAAVTVAAARLLPAEKPVVATGMTLTFAPYTYIRCDDVEVTTDEWNYSVPR